MKGKRKIQYHPGQENKTGKATYASATGVNSSTVNPSVADHEVGVPGQERPDKFPETNKRRNVFPKISKHQKT